MSNETDINTLLANLKSNNRLKRYDAAIKLAFKKNTAGADILLESIHDENHDIRTHSAFALAEIGDLRGIDHIIDEYLTLDSKNGEYFCLMRRALMEFGERGLPIVSRAVGQNRFSDDNYFNEIGDAAIPFVLQLFEHKEGVVRDYALRFISDIAKRHSDDKYINLIIKGLSDPEEQVRMRALIEFGNLKDPRSIPSLIDLLTDDNPAIRSLATKALCMPDHPEIVDPLIEMLSDPDESVRSSAAYTLSDFSDERVNGPMKYYLKMNNVGPIRGSRFERFFM